jgi:hypothetical protein
VSNLHWWTQALLRDEPGIRNNLRDDPQGLFAVPGATARD